MAGETSTLPANKRKMAFAKCSKRVSPIDSSPMMQQIIATGTKYKQMAPNIAGISDIAYRLFIIISIFLLLIFF
ncbi:MAG: hypothetical protein PHF35_00655 [Candidatus Moranbacteria bacterium]|nr:hypothetical protein [Candidatus Moranbacteria bacterium]